jgi:hypothetical protein
MKLQSNGPGLSPHKIGFVKDKENTVYQYNGNDSHSDSEKPFGCFFLHLLPPCKMMVGSRVDEILYD